MEKLFSSGKLLLMGEYAVLHGADAVCLPLKTGQELTVTDTTPGEIHWKWTYKDHVLAHFTLNAATLDERTILAGSTDWVLRLLHLVRKQDPDFMRTGGKSLVFVNDFPPQWGLGSSSATISSLCRLAGLNPYEVNRQLMGGSGADIACTTAPNWFLYRNDDKGPQTWEIPFNYHFSDNTWFVYSGKKMETASHLKSFSSHARPAVSWMTANDYVYRFISVPTLPEAMKIIYEHELLIGEAIGEESISHRFCDFPGKVKSLGAWGGDFFMALSQQDSGFVKKYFQGRGYDTVLSWEELTEKKFF